MEGQSKNVTSNRICGFGLVGNGLHGPELLPTRHPYIYIGILEAVILGSGSHKETLTPDTCMFDPGWESSLTVELNRTGHPMLESAGGGESAKDVMCLPDHICMIGPEGGDLPKGGSLNSRHPGLKGGGESNLDAMHPSGLVFCVLEAVVHWGCSLKELDQAAHICSIGPRGGVLPRNRSPNPGHPDLLGGGESDLDVMRSAGLVFYMCSYTGGRPSNDRKNPVGPVGDQLIWVTSITGPGMTGVSGLREPMDPVLGMMEAGKVAIFTVALRPQAHCVVFFKQIVKGPMESSRDDLNTKSIGSVDTGRIESLRAREGGVE